MDKIERSLSQHKVTPRTMKNARTFVMEYSSGDSRLLRRIKAGKANGDKLKRNSAYTIKNY